MPFNKSMTRRPIATPTDTQAQYADKVEAQLNEISADLTSIEVTVDALEAASGVLADGSVPFTGDLDLGGNRATNLGDGVAATDAVTVQQLQAVVKDRVFADLATLGPTVPAAPTVAEVQAFATAGAHTDVVVYYTGTNTATDAPTHVWHVDGSGAPTLVLSPQASTSAMTGATASTAGTGGTVPGPGTAGQDLVLHGDGVWRQPVPNWTASTDYSQGGVVYQGGRMWRRNTAGQSGLVFDAAEQAQWTALSSAASLADQLLTASGGNVNLVAGSHSRVDSTSGVVAGDTVTVPAAPTVGAYGEFYNGSSVELVVAIGGGDSFIGSPRLAVPPDTGMSWRCVAANTIEVVGTGRAQHVEVVAVADWSAPAGGVRTITVTEAAHQMGSAPVVSVQAGTGPWVQVAGHEVSVAANGDVTVTVTDGDEFDGRLVMR